MYLEDKIYILREEKIQKKAFKVQKGGFFLFGWIVFFIFLMDT